MKIITPGHLYELANFQFTEAPGQVIQFIQKEPNPDDPTKLITIYDGTTNEELLRVLIDRLRFLSSKFPSRENSTAITKLQEALFWLEERTRDRIARQVEGKHLS